MKTAIMQPYFMPYLGYWQLINAVDNFVVYDNIQYTKKGWFNRNRILQNGKDTMVTIPIKKDSDYLNVDQRFISESYNREKLLSQIKNAYQKAPYLLNIFPSIERIVKFQSDNLFQYIFNSIKEICQYLEIDTDILVSSNINIDHSLKSQDKVIAICQALGTNEYINPIGGRELYNHNAFKESNIELKFIEMFNIEFRQFSNPFVPCLSIIDVLMFNDIAVVKSFLEKFELK